MSFSWNKVSHDIWIFKSYGLWLVRIGSKINKCKIHCFVFLSQFRNMKGKMKKKTIFRKTSLFESNAIYNAIKTNIYILERQNLLCFNKKIIRNKIKNCKFAKNNLFDIFFRPYITKSMFVWNFEKRLPPRKCRRSEF